MMSNSKLSQIKLTLFFLISTSSIIANADLFYIDQYCYDAFGTYSPFSDYGDNVETAVSALVSKASKTYYNTHTVGTGDSKVNAYYACRFDISPEACESCVASTATNISGCIGNNVEALIVYEECTLHYSNRTIFSVMETRPWLSRYSLNRNPEDEVQFSQSLDSLVADLIADTASTAAPYFSTKTSKYSTDETLYGLAQCNPDITSSECKTCLQTGFEEFMAAKDTTASAYGQVFLESCRVSYLLTSESLTKPWKFAETFGGSLITTPPPISIPGPNSAPDPLSFPEPSSVPDSSSTPETPSIPDRSTIPSGQNSPPDWSFPPSAGTRGSSTVGAMIAIIIFVTHYLF